MELTIKERNENAIKRMKQKLQDRLDNTFHNLNERQFVDFLKATNLLKNTPLENDLSDIQLALFLLSKIDYSDVGEASKIDYRFTLVANHDWGFNNAVRDINNMYEMGK